MLHNHQFLFIHLCIHAPFIYTKVAVKLIDKYFRFIVQKKSKKKPQEKERVVPMKNNLMILTVMFMSGLVDRTRPKRCIRKPFRSRRRFMEKDTREQLPGKWRRPQVAHVDAEDPVKL